MLAGWSAWLEWLAQPAVLLTLSIVGAAGCLLLGRALALRGRGRLKKELETLRDKVVRSEAQAREGSRMIARMKGEQGTVANLALSLPGVVRELNRGDLEPRAVPPLILNLAEAVFQPGYVLLYIARAGAKREDAGPVLQLVRQQGYVEIPASLKTIPFGSGTRCCTACPWDCHCCPYSAPWSGPSLHPCRSLVSW